MLTLNPMPLLILGLGHATLDSPNLETHREIIAAARNLDVRYLDTSRIYTRGGSESFIGSEGLASEFMICTKAPMDHAPGGATTAGIVEQWKKSEDALKTSKVWCYLLHHPDENTPIGEAMEGIQALYLVGHFEHWGFSNFSPSEVQEAYTYMTVHGYVLPTIYQVSYGVATRRNASTLFPLLRKLNIAIQAYSCLGAGFLTRTPEQIQNQEGNFDSSTVLGKILQDIYGKPSYLAFLRQYNDLAVEANLSKASIAYRWAVYHGELDGEKGDQVVLGASSAKQLRETMGEIRKGPLEGWVVERLDELWKTVEADAPDNNFATYARLKREGKIVEA